MPNVNCHNKNTTVVITEGNSNVGGIVGGIIQAENVSRCSNTGKVMQEEYQDLDHLQL